MFLTTRRYRRYSLPNQDKKGTDLFYEIAERAGLLACSVCSKINLSPFLRLFCGMSVVEGMFVLALFEEILAQFGAVPRTAPLSDKYVAQFLTNCATAHRSRWM
jgi:hypothetical protein